MEVNLTVSYDFSGKVALVTGASGGIGRATALAFARAGASVVVSDVNAAGGEETVALAAAAGGTAIFHPCDVADPAAVKALVARAVGHFGRLDFGHNNAGITNLTADEWDDEVWRRSLAINLDGVMHCMREEAAAMLDHGGGAIVNTASINGFTGNARQPAYVATKHGVIGLTRHGALKWARDNIRVNAVCPGVIETPMTDAVARNPDLRRAMEALTPMGRMGQPDEVAGAVLWLCSVQASFVTGHPLVIDGGATVS
ncbi:short chain dehydrogenase [Sphingopyxis lindanitolerans]|uniref:Short chain dehydrogenase n=1 Tax=Sphingopyxis lindanitolerans TaxID=2054227 RepID=A0A2S8B293_9SPHN|nr:short chain dehydrogenase [Sphingopyxis lindanitolerans]